MIYAAGILSKMIKPIVIWYILILPVAWIADINPTENCVTIESTKIHLLSSTVNSGISFPSHRCNTSAISIFKGIENKHKASTENFDEIKEILCNLNRSPIPSLFINWGFIAFEKVEENWAIAPFNWLAIPYAAFARVPRKILNITATPWLRPIIANPPNRFQLVKPSISFIIDLLAYFFSVKRYFLYLYKHHVSFITKVKIAIKTIHRP